MISVKTNANKEEGRAWKDRLCCECVYFEHVPFTVGRCARLDKIYPPSILDERLGYDSKYALAPGAVCGQRGQFFTAKRKAA